MWRKGAMTPNLRALPDLATAATMPASNANAIPH